MNFKTLALATVAVVGISGAASAATLSIEGGTTVTFGTNNFSAGLPGCGASCYDPNGSAPTFVGDETITAFFGPYVVPNHGIFITGPATIRVTFLGKEAGAVNAALSTAGGSVSNAVVGSSFVTSVMGPGLLDFLFRVTTAAGGAQLNASAGFGGNFIGGAAIAFSSVSPNGRSVFAFFDDGGARKNLDWDDMVVRIDVIPVPAAGLLLLGGLGAMAALKRRRKAA